MSDECCFDPQVILDDIPAAIASGALTINNASKIGMSREQLIIAASQSPMGTFVSEEGCCFDIDAILADIPGAIEAGVLNQNNAHRIGLSRGGFAVILAMIQGGGGGGGPFLPLAGGTMDTNADIAFDNGSRIHQTPGSNGIDQVCSIDYVHRWSNGLLYILDQSGNIRAVRYGMSLVPDTSYDSTQGYMVGSSFSQDNGTTFICSNDSPAAAVWTQITPDQELNTTSEVDFTKLRLTSSINGEVLKIDGNAVAGNDVGFAVYNNTGQKANSFWFNIIGDHVGIGVEQDICRIYASLPLAIILPTDATNLPSGSIWNDSGVISLVP